MRHHSPALAAAIPALLDACGPEVLLVELPAQAAPWLDLLADDRTVAPIALAGTDGESAVAFYPFADFSPELAALRWARARGVPALPCDLPLGDRSRAEVESGVSGPSPRPGYPGYPAYKNALQRTATGRAGDGLWDRQVEARAPGSSVEQIRRAALAVGWALRMDAADGVTPRDLAREAWMRAVLRSVAGRRAAMLIGAFHAPAMSQVDQDGPEPEIDGAFKAVKQDSMSLVPYTFALLDERSGYPAGIRDPRWQQSVFEFGGSPEAVRAAAAGHIVEVCRALRANGHPAGPAEAVQALRFALDLAALRGLSAPARSELIESVQVVLGNGDTLGRGRAVAKALESALVGHRRGRLAPGTPVSGLRRTVSDLLAELRLPGPEDPEREIRLDPLRSPLDRRREVALSRLSTCGVPYAKPREITTAGGLAALTTVWRADWTPQTEAHLNILTTRGFTLAQAAENTLRQTLFAQREADGPTTAETLEGLFATASCGISALLDERAGDLTAVVIPTATLSELMRAAELTDRIRAGHIPGTPAESASFDPDLGERIDTAALRLLDGLSGSRDLDDARALTAFTQRGTSTGGALRADTAPRRLEHEGAAMIAAAAGACRVLAGTAEPAQLGLRVAGWIDTATHQTARSALRDRLQGLLAATGPLLTVGPAVLEPLVDRVGSLTDKEGAPGMSVGHLVRFS